MKNPPEFTGSEISSDFISLSDGWNYYLKRYGEYRNNHYVQNHSPLFIRRYRSKTIMPKFCPTCGKPLQFDNAEICPSCGVRLQAPPSVPAEIRIPFLAVVLSFFFPGWGQWYNGKTWDGLGFFGACLGSYVIMIILAILMQNQSSASLLVVILFMVYLGIWIYGMYNAYTTAKQINQREVDFQGKSGLFWLPIVFIVLGIIMIIVSAVIAAFVFGMAGNVS